MSRMTCPTCGKEFESKRSTAKYCSPKCRYHKHLATKKRITIPNNVRFSILRRDRFRCRYCGAGPTLDAKGKPRLTELRVDHVVSVEDGGALTAASNLVTACNACNAGKGKLSLDPSEVPVAAK